MDPKKYTDIQQRIDKYRVKEKKSKSILMGNQAFNIAIELVAALIVGVMIGFLFDNLFDSKPLFLIICMILAIVAAFRLIWNKYIKN